MATPDRVRAAGLVFASLALAAPLGAAERYDIGHVATPAQVQSWNLDVAPDGRNLPAGEGSVRRGREVFATQCAGCHGERGEGGSLGDKLVGGQGTLATPAPVRTVGSYWPYATTLFDYVRRAMPLNAPQSLSTEDVYAVSGYVLFLNGLLAEEALVNAKLLTQLRMPNRDGFVADPRPDVHNTACVRDCVK
jgi:cytochrome c